MRFGTWTRLLEAGTVALTDLMEFWVERKNSLGSLALKGVVVNCHRE